MAKVKFIYLKNKFEIINLDKYTFLSDLLLKYCSIINQDKNELYFIYKGKILSLDQKIKIKDLKNKDILISVFKIKYEKNINNIVLNNIICPKCKEELNLVLLNFEEDKIILDKCKNKHKTIYNSLKDFIESQKMKIKMKCKKCENNINDYNNELYYNSKEEYICSICKNSGDIAIKACEKYSKCNKHNEEFILYCNDCNINLCYNCEKNHMKHNRIYLKQIKIKENKIKEIKNNIKEFKDILNKYKEKIKEMNILYINICKEAMNNIENYMALSQYILYALDNLKNFESFQNSNINLIKLRKEINHFLNETDIYEKFKYLLKEFDKIPKNSITLEYFNNLDLKIFSKDFVENNKDNCYLIIENKKYNIQEYCPIKAKSEKIKIKLIEKTIISNMSKMFYKCSSLLSLSDISKWNTNNVNNMSGMFSSCSRLSSLPDISKWNTNNVNNMSYMFNSCSKLSSLPDISKWNINNVTNISFMFSDCSSLSSIPDISKWNTNNVNNMSFLFNGCPKLSSLPDISKWNTHNVNNMSFLFNGCSKLSSLPDISKWNTNNVNNMSYMFNGCSKLSSLPDISKWNINNVTNISFMFNDCSSLSSISDISKWDTNNAINISFMFSDCSLLSSIPDISKWNINNVTNMSGMFNCCSSLSSLPDISKWNINEFCEKFIMFKGCTKLVSLPKI